MPEKDRSSEGRVGREHMVVIGEAADLYGIPHVALQRALRSGALETHTGWRGERTVRLVRAEDLEALVRAEAATAGEHGARRPTRPPEPSSQSGSLQTGPSRPPAARASSSGDPTQYLRNQLEVVRAQVRSARERHEGLVEELVRSGHEVRALFAKLSLDEESRRVAQDRLERERAEIERALGGLRRLRRFTTLSVALAVLLSLGVLWRSEQRTVAAAGPARSPAPAASGVVAGTVPGAAGPDEVSDSSAGEESRAPTLASLAGEPSPAPTLPGPSTGDPSAGPDGDGRGQRDERGEREPAEPVASVAPPGAADAGGRGGADGPEPGVAGMAARAGAAGRGADASGASAPESGPGSTARPPAPAGDVPGWPAPRARTGDRACRLFALTRRGQPLRAELGPCAGRWNPDLRCVVGSARLPDGDYCRHHALFARELGGSLERAHAEASLAVREGFLPPLVEVRVESAGSAVLAREVGVWIQSGFEAGTGGPHAIEPHVIEPLGDREDGWRIRSWVRYVDFAGVEQRSTFQLDLELGDGAVPDRVLAFAWNPTSLPLPLAEGEAGAAH